MTPHCFQDGVYSFATGNAAFKAIKRTHFTNWGKSHGQLPIMGLANRELGSFCVFWHFFPADSNMAWQSSQMAARSPNSSTTANVITAWMGTAEALHHTNDPLRGFGEERGVCGIKIPFSSGLGIIVSLLTSRVTPLPPQPIPVEQPTLKVTL